MSQRFNEFDVLIIVFMELKRLTSTTAATAIFLGRLRFKGARSSFGCEPITFGDNRAASEPWRYFSNNTRFQQSTIFQVLAYT
jgi:hypothetical protein